MRLASTTDPRLTDLVRIGMGEGFSTYSGQFEGKPAFVVDCGSMDDFLNEEDRSTDNVTVHVFNTDAARDGYIAKLRQESPAALGRLTSAMPSTTTRQT